MFITEQLRAVRQDRSLYLSSPAYRLLHLAETTCAFRTKIRPRAPSREDFVGLVNLYQDFREPAPSYFLTPPHRLDLLQHYWARQQLPSQKEPNGPDIRRAALIFNDALYPRSLPRIQQALGIGLSDWINLCFITWSVIDSWPETVFNEARLLVALAAASDADKAHTAYKLLSRTPEEMADNFRSRRQTDHDWLFDLGLPCGFESWPILRLGKGRAIAVHPPYIFYRGLEGPYDIGYQHASTSFGNEVGQAFQGYVGKVLADLPAARVVGERDLARLLTGEQVCDFVVVADSFLLLVEAKAVKYTNDKTSIEAVRNTNATVKIAKGIAQLITTARLLIEGRFEPVIGARATRPILGVVVSFGSLYANDDGFWQDAIGPHLDAGSASAIDAAFAYRPQVMNVTGLEYLIGVSRVEGMPIDAMMGEKLAQPYIHTGEWDVYLRTRMSTDAQPTCWDGVLTQLFSPYQQQMAASSSRYS